MGTTDKARRLKLIDTSCDISQDIRQNITKETYKKIEEDPNNEKGK